MECLITTGERCKGHYCQAQPKFYIYKELRMQKSNSLASKLWFWGLFKVQPPTCHILKIQNLTTESPLELAPRTFVFLSDIYGQTFKVSEYQPGQTCDKNVCSCR